MTSRARTLLTAVAVAITAGFALWVTVGAVTATVVHPSPGSTSVSHFEAVKGITPNTTGAPSPGPAAAPAGSSAGLHVAPVAPLEGLLPASLPVSAPTLQVPILMYHMVDYSPPSAGPYSAALTVSTEEFGRQMDYLASHGFHPVTLEDIYAAMAGERTLPARPVALTFDDGNKDNFTVAFPILRAHGFVATFFVITGFVENKLSMTWDDLRTMQAAGMSIESHTFDHKDLRTVDAAALSRELTGSRATIASQLGRAPLALCYPGGKFNAAVMEAARTAGYLMAVTTRPGRILDPASRYEWPRVRVPAESNLQSFISGLT